MGSKVMGVGAQGWPEERVTIRNCTVEAPGEVESLGRSPALAPAPGGFGKLLQDSVFFLCKVGAISFDACPQSVGGVRDAG